MLEKVNAVMNPMSSIVKYVQPFLYYNIFSSFEAEESNSRAINFLGKLIVVTL